MQRYQLSLEKANILRQRFIDGQYHSWLLAKELRVSTITTWRYKREFEKIRAEYPDLLTDFGFYPGEPNRPHWETPKWIQFSYIMPALLSEEKTATLETSKIFEKYHQLSSDPYAWKTFKYNFVKWVRDNVTLTPQKLLDHIAPEDKGHYGIGGFQMTIDFGKFQKRCHLLNKAQHVKRSLIE